MSSAHGARVASMFAVGKAQEAKVENDARIAAAQTEADRRIAEGRTGALGAIDAGQPLSLAALGSGYGAARSSYADAGARYQPYVEGGAKGWSGYLDASGANGAEGSDRATASFRASPNYQWDVDQSLDGVNRHAAATGTLAGGNTLAALSDRAGHMADQEYGTYVGRLRDIGQTGFAATGAQAGYDKATGDSFAEQGRGEASIYDTNAARRAGIETGAATTGVSSLLGLTGLGVQNTTGAANTIAAAGAAGLKAGDKVKEDQQNMWLNLAKLGVDFGGKAMAAFA
jgi:hypothetical protein